MKIICSDCNLTFESVEKFQEHCFEMKQKKFPTDRILSFRKGIIFCCLLFLCSCSVITSQNVQQLTPEQIRALGETNQHYLGCTVIGGPPIGGRSTLLILPPNYPVTVKFGPDCQILN